MATARRAAAETGGHSALILDFMLLAIPAGSGGNGWVLMEIHTDDFSSNLTMHETFVEITKA
jgi:hypothetical protein